MFTDEFLDNLPENPYEALKKLELAFLKFVRDTRGTKEPLTRIYGLYVDAFAAVEAFAEAHKIDIDQIDLGDKIEQNISDIEGYFARLGKIISPHLQRKHLEEARTKYRLLFGAGLIYEFSDGDLNRIQELINELRDAITASELFDEKHKQRILKRLEKLQAELHKKMSSVDQFWALLSEAGVVLGKFGEDAKPFVDRITEIGQIGWRAQVRAEELPSGLPFPLLSDGDEKKEKD